ncbi:MAG TPA: hypothetical protein VK277_16075 [Acidimicrobiales bacterium]|nr:hypothetical protein [Acidimicrobiales bacterium]
MSQDGGSRRDRQAAEQLEPGESIIAAATFNTGSIERAALSGVSARIVRLVVTDSRVMLFATSDLAFNLNLGKLLRSIPLAEIVTVESSTGRMIGFKGLKLGITLSDGSVLPFEASGLTFASAKKLAPLLEATVASHKGAERPPETQGSAE